MGQLSLLLWAWLETTRSIGRGRLWVPLLLLAAVQWVVLLLLTQLHQPLLAPILFPVVRLLGGEPALHYPVFYIALPTIFSRLTLAIDLLLGSLLIGAAFLLVWHGEHPAERFRSPYGQARESWMRLILGRVPPTLALGAIFYLVPTLLLGPDLDGGAARIRLLRYGGLLAAALVEGLVLYVPLLILTQGERVGRALARSGSMAVRKPVATFGAVLVPGLVQIPSSYLLRHSETIVTRLSPEMVAWLLALVILVYTLAAFYIVGAGGRIFRVQTERGTL